MAGYIGYRKVPTTSDGGGIWTVNKQAEFKKAAIWPNLFFNARYWRILQTQNTWNTGSGNYHAVIADINMYSTTDGSGSPLSGVAFAASTEYSETYNAAKAGDNNSGTIWSASGQVSAHWWSADFGSDVRVRSLLLRPDNGGYYAQEYYLQCSSNNSDWTYVATLTTTNTLTISNPQTFTNLN